MSAPKHFVHDPSTLVSSSLRSLPILNPSLDLDLKNKVLYRKSPFPAAKFPDVAIISGGGSGHEPSFGAFVGFGLLSAAVAGSIFASPSSQQIATAIERASATAKEILVTVMNYTGDVLNFGVAVEKAKVRNAGLRIEMVVIGDDVAVPRSKAGKVGRRGIAGTVLVHKITGAMAELGYDLDTIAKTARLVNDNLVSIGLALDKVHVPGRSTAEYLQENIGLEEVEVGLGIHNEPGSARVTGPDASLPNLVRDGLRQLLDSNDSERSFLKQHSKQQIVLINNLGGLSVLELGAVVTEVAEQLQRTYDIEPIRVYAGTFMTSLNCSGFSVSLLNHAPTSRAHDFPTLLDLSCGAVGWTANTSSGFWEKHGAEAKPTKEMAGPADEASSSVWCELICDMPQATRALRSGLESLIKEEPDITKFDTIVGDGDCGTTLKRGAEGT